jgi:hypothetical protein
MRRILPVLAVGAAVLLSGCSVDGEAPGKFDPTSAGPPTATATPDPTATELADRYRKAGGDPHVYGIQHAQNKDNVVLLTVWTRKKNGYVPFDDFATNLASFLAGEGVRLDRGYVLNVYGPDGTQLHSYDTTPENNP